MKNLQKWNLHGIFQTWHMMQILCNLCNCNCEGEVLPIFGHQKIGKREIFSLTKFMPKHNQGLAPNATKDNNFTSSCRIITITKKTEINVKLKNVAT
jgi:hypothetical protein